MSFDILNRIDEFWSKVAITGAKGILDEFWSKVSITGAKGILRISGGRHDIVASNTGLVSIGCHTYPIERWLESYRAVGKKEEYSPEEIDDYAERLKFVASWIAREKTAASKQEASA